MRRMHRLMVSIEPGGDPVPTRSVVNLDSVESVTAGLIVERLGRPSEMACLSRPAVPTCCYVAECLSNGKPNTSLIEWSMTESNCWMLASSP